MNILVVEDDPGDTHFARLAFGSDQGFRLTCVQRLSDALTSLRERDYDVVVLDLSLPDSSGLAGLEAIREIDPSISIVVMTGLSDDDTARQSLERGAQEYLVKGEDPSAVLRRTVLHAIQRQMFTEENRRLMNELAGAKRSLEDRNEVLAGMCKTAHQFVDDVSHEFRTPLTVIKEYVALLREGLLGPLNEQQREYLAVAGIRTDDLATLVDDMLDTSRLEAGLLGMTRRACAVSELLDRVRPLFDRKAAARNISLQLTIDDPLPIVYCDPDKIGRVLINLTANALKFSSESGTVQIHVSSEPHEHVVRFEIRDHGPGIDEAGVSQLFQRFIQIDGRPQASVAGFGLGLHIAKNLVHLNLGDITVQSRLGAGTVFSFTVPTADTPHLIRRYLERIDTFRDGSELISIIEARVDSYPDEAVLEELDHLIQHHMRRYDLTIRVSPQEWLLVVAANHPDTGVLVGRFQQARDQHNKNRPAGLLPTIAFQRIGTWSAQDDRDEIIHQVRRCLEGSTVLAGT